MLIDSREFEDRVSLDASVCIIGAGVAGITLAKELSSAKLAVVLVEAGDRNFSLEAQSYYSAQDAPDGFPLSEHSRLRMLGGSSNHWENSVEQLDPLDFERRAWIPNSGWPITFTDIAPYYSLAGRYCGVGVGGAAYHDWSSHHEFADIASESENFETAVVRAAVPPTRFFENYGGVLEAAKNIRLVTNASLVSVTFDQESKVVGAAELRSSSGNSFRVRAKYYVLATGGIENARLLLHINRQHKDAIGNQKGNVGRYFMEHPVLRAAHFYPTKSQRLPESFRGLTIDGRKITARLKLQSGVLETMRATNLRLFFREADEFALSLGLESAQYFRESIERTSWPDDVGRHVANILGDLDVIYSRATGRRPSSSYDGYQVVSMIEQTPSRDNRISLGDVRDAAGVPRVIIDWRLSDSDKAMAWKSLELLAADPKLNSEGRFRLMDEMTERIWGDQLGFSAHHMGTTRMGLSPKDSVVDADCRVHGVHNLFVGGSSVFSTGGHVPPTLTLVALAIRLSRHLEGKL